MIRKVLLLMLTLVFAVVSCQKYDDEIADLQRQIDELSTAASKINSNVTALAAIADALKAADEVVSFSPLSEGGKVVGYTVTFRDSGSVTVYNSTANVSIGLFEGKYYWMVGNNWLTDADGAKVEACKAEIIPQFIISSGVIKVSLDNGSTWTAVGEVGTPVLDEVIDSDDSVVFVLAGGQRITLAKQKPLALTLSTYNLSMEAGGGRTISYTITGGDDQTQVLLYAKDGWSATVSKTNSSEGMIQVRAPQAASSSAVLVFASDNQGRSVVTSLAVESLQ